MYVAGYCRVSTDHTDQLNSFESQQQYFRDYIARQPEWKLYEIYADEGISGTGTKKRAAFNRMIQDAHEGRFSLILTKEVSRFSRNILDTISYTRKLRAVGVGVRFLTDGIDTLAPEGEMLLSFLASLAQEESRRTSSRVVWGQTRQMERGVVFGHSLLGYDVQGGQMTINPEQAELVRMIFEKYAMEQLGTAQIARFLTENGYKTRQGNTKWTASTIVKILKNEKYVGDLIQKKSFTPDYLTHEKCRNTGQVSLITIKNHHEQIITRELWNMAQNQLSQRNLHAKSNSGHSNRYIFSGKIKCGKCGASFVGRMKYGKNGEKMRRWCCSTASRFGADACGIGKLIRDDDAMQMMKTALCSIGIDRSAIVSEITSLVLDAVDSDMQNQDVCCRRMLREYDRISLKKVTLLDSYFSGEITKKDMQTMKQHYDQELESINRRISGLKTSAQQGTDMESIRQRIHSAVESILSGQTESPAFYKTLLDSLTVFPDRHMELRLHELSHIFCFNEKKCI